MAIETEMFRLLFLCHEREELDGVIYEREEMEILPENSKGGMMYPIFVVALGAKMNA